MNDIAKTSASTGSGSCVQNMTLNCDRESDIYSNQKKRGRTLFSKSQLSMDILQHPSICTKGNAFITQKREFCL